MNVLLYEIKLSQSFKKRMAKFKKHQVKVSEKLPGLLKLLQVDPRHPKLKTHKLKGELSEKYAFSLDWQTRVVFELTDESTILLVDIGTHDQVYR